MSTTFWIEDGPTVQVRDFDWDGEPAFEDDGVTPRFYADDQYSLNVADLNFKCMFAALGYAVPDGNCGKFEVSEIPDLRRRLISVLNGNLSHLERPFTHLKSDVQELEREGNVVTVGRQMQIIDCGTTVERVRSRLEQFLEIAVAASKLNKPIVFA